MAAFAGLGIDNAEVELDAAEVPIMDGSSEPFNALLKKAGVQGAGESKKIRHHPPSGHRYRRRPSGDSFAQQRF